MVRVSIRSSSVVNVTVFPCYRPVIYTRSPNANLVMLKADHKTSQTIGPHYYYYYYYYYC